MKKTVCALTIGLVLTLANIQPARAGIILQPPAPTQPPCPEGQICPTSSSDPAQNNEGNTESDGLSELAATALQTLLSLTRLI